MTTIASRPLVLARLAAAAALAVLGAGCAARSPQATEGETAGAAATTGAPRSGRLIARTTPAVSGNVSLVPSDEPGRMTATIEVEAPPGRNDVLSWRIVRGSCGVSSGTIVGSATLYPVIRVEPSGRGLSTATIPLPAETGSLSARVFASPTNFTLVACGDLR